MVGCQKVVASPQARDETFLVAVKAQPRWINKTILGILRRGRNDSGYPSLLLSY